MNCPKCGSEPTFDHDRVVKFSVANFHLPAVNWCEKCGYAEYYCPECKSKMERAVRSGDSSEKIRLTCFKCGHEEKVKP